MRPKSRALACASDFAREHARRRGMAIRHLARRGGDLIGIARPRDVAFVAHWRGNSLFDPRCACFIIITRSPCGNISSSLSARRGNHRQLPGEPREGAFIALVRRRAAQHSSRASCVRATATVQSTNGKAPVISSLFVRRRRHLCCESIMPEINRAHAAWLPGRRGNIIRHMHAEATPEIYEIRQFRALVKAAKTSARISSSSNFKSLAKKTRQQMWHCICFHSSAKATISGGVFRKYQGKPRNPRHALVKLDSPSINASRRYFVTLPRREATPHSPICY